MIKNYLSKLIIIVVITIFLCACGLTTQQEGLIGKAEPSTRYYLINGSAHAISEHLGKNIVLVFWDAFCHHCQQTLPKINDLAKSFTDSADIKFISISINKQSDEEKVRSKIKEIGLDSSMENAFSGNDIFDESFQAFYGDRIPYIILIDKEGIINWIGHDADELREKLIALLRNH